MREYEFTYIVQPDAEDARLAEIHGRVDSIITGGQGVILLRDDWGKRKLAYEIQKFQKGHYFLLQLLGDGKFVPELERILRLDPDVLRFLTVLIDPKLRDVDARMELAKKEAAEREERRLEREKLDEERNERERAELAARQAASPAAEESDDTQPLPDAAADAAAEAPADSPPAETPPAADATEKAGGEE